MAAADEVSASPFAACVVAAVIVETEKIAAGAAAAPTLITVLAGCGGGSCWVSPQPAGTGSSCGRHESGVANKYGCRSACHKQESETRSFFALNTTLKID